MAGGGPQVVLDRRFNDSLLELEPIEAHRSLKAVAQYQDNPDHPGLNFERLQQLAGRQRLCTIRASRELRILMAVDGDVAVMLRAGHHDAIYDLAGTSRFVVPQADAPGLVPIVDGAVDLDGKPLRPGRAVPTEPADVVGALDHWSTPELQAVGLSEEAIGRLRSVAVDDLLDGWPDIPESTLDLVLRLSELTPEQYAHEQETDEETDVDLRGAILERGAFGGLSDFLSADELVALAEAPIEDWMVFLHPSQRELIQREYTGVARIRGSAGTGKTVVALHRAARLARHHRDGDLPVLFTTFINNLPPVFENLFGRLPGTSAGRVVFTNVDKLAHQVCREAGERVVLDPRLVDDAFEAACAEVVVAGSPLKESGLSRRYLREEINSVIKGRGLASVDEYLRIERKGRRTRFSPVMREQAWLLREALDRRLRESEVMDFPDVVLRALEVSNTEQPRFRAAIVDESQDLTLAALKLVAAVLPNVAGEGQLLLVGDGAQRIYPGGFGLRAAGMDVRGRSAVLRLNYRNTAAIASTAAACAGESVFDFDDDLDRAAEMAPTLRDGLAPLLVDGGSEAGQCTWIARHIRHLVDIDAVRPGDIGVSAASNRLAKDVRRALEQAGFATEGLDKFEGVPNDRVKVGTFFRAKGLEFKIMFAAGVSESSFPSPRRPGESEEEYADRHGLAVSQLFVAMTRARDRLIVLHDGEPAEVLASASGCFEEVTA